MVKSFSAGHVEHEYTTGYSWPIIQKFFNDKCKDDLVSVTDLSGTY